MRRLFLLGLASSLVACGGSGAGAAGETESSGNPSEESSTETSTEESTEGEAESESESGVLEDLPAPERPLFENPAEAEDLDPDPDAVRVELTARPFEYEIDGESISGYAYNEQVPGPTIRAKKGDTVTVVFKNELGMPSTIHWHGLHVPFDMDGVVWMGAPIETDESFEYSFTVNQSGTYWYHPHFDTAQQVDLGLYGAFIVDDPADPEVDEEMVMLLDGWGETSPPHAHHEGTLLNWTVNGLVDPVHRPAAGLRIRARVIDVSNAGYADIAYPGLRHIGSDQGVIASLGEPESVLLSPGDRADFELLVGVDDIELMNRPYSLFGPIGTEPERLMSVEPEGETMAPSGAAWPFSGEAPSPDPGYADVLYTFMGDTDAGAWSINGEFFPDITIETLPLNGEAIIEVRNVSASEHPFHLHGYEFEVLSRDDEPPAFATWEDTINVGIAERIRVRIVADNPGDWMAHCHILPHAEEGMMTVLRVE